MVFIPIFIWCVILMGYFLKNTHDSDWLKGLINFFYSSQSRGSIAWCQFWKNSAQVIDLITEEVSLQGKIGSTSRNDEFMAIFTFYMKTKAYKLSRKMFGLFFLELELRSNSELEGTSLANNWSDLLEIFDVRALLCHFFCIEWYKTPFHLGVEEK